MRGGLCGPRYNCQLFISLQQSSIYRSNSQIFVQNRYFFLPDLHSIPLLSVSLSECCPNIFGFGVEKLKWCGYPVAKFFWRYVYSFR